MNKLDNLDKLHKFWETPNLPKLNHVDAENKNRPVRTKGFPGGASSELSTSESRSLVYDTLQRYTVHGILQARILKCLAFPTQGSNPVSHTAATFFTSWATREAQQ